MLCLVRSAAVGISTTLRTQGRPGLTPTMYGRSIKL
jgi:hypothetical protein